MNGFVEVISPGLYSTLQDKGRFGFRRFGVPVSGAMDQQSATLANLILNNSPDAAVLEITISGPRLLFQSDTIICLTGADLSPLLNDVSFPTNQPGKVTENSILSFGKPVQGCRAYLSVKNGFQTPVVLGSRSYYAAVTSQGVIKKGDRLPIDPYSSGLPLQSAVKNNDNLFESDTISCSEGPEFGLLNEQSKELILNSRFTVSRENNRMGYRLIGEPLEYPSGYNMLTSAVMPGTVQLTPSGQLIVLMRDCQTTGGYPRVLQLSQTGINQLAQKLAGDTIAFAVT